MGFLFLNTEGHHTWEVPDDVTEARFALWGASWDGGGTGVIISDLVPGETLHFNLGGNAINSGWNGGGASTPATAGGIFSTGGGGATDIRRGGNSLSNRVAVAAGVGGATAYAVPGIGLAPRSGGGPPGGDWPGTYWVYGYDRGDGVTEYRYESPGYVGPDGPASGPFPISDYMHGNEPPSGANGADTATHTIVSHTFLPANPDPFPPTTITVYLGAGGGGYVGGEGGEVWFRQADPFFNPTNMNLRIADTYDGAPGLSWIDPSLAPYVHGAARPDLPEGGLYYATRLLSGAIFVAWDETLEQQQWRVGRVGPQWNP